jgi:dihydropteroate synthase
MKFWQTTRFRIDLAKPLVMGIVNVTPDSFSDGGQYLGVHAAMRHGEQLLKDGAHILDIGGESSRPGAAPLSVADELVRVLPVVKEAVKLDVPISVDTYKPEVMQAVLDAGADIINDIWALRQPGALEIVSRYPLCGLVLMHMHRDPQTMQQAPMEQISPTAVIRKVALDLHAWSDRVQHQLETAGIIADAEFQAKHRIMLDPGIGFGKTPSQNFALLSRQNDLLELGYPLLVGWSRKSSLGTVTGLEADERLIPSVAAAVLAVERGAHIVRAHDVRETVQALKVWLAMQLSRGM